MHGSIPMLMALAASFTTVYSLPQPKVAPREPAAKPKYSVVPLEPSDQAPNTGSGGGRGKPSNGGGKDGGNKGDKSGGDNGGDDDGDGVVTVIETVIKTESPIIHTVVRTEKPLTYTVTRTADIQTVTKVAQTTVSVIDIIDEVTQTVIVSPIPSRPASASPSSKGRTPASRVSPHSDYGGVKPTSLSNSAKPTTATSEEPSTFSTRIGTVRPSGPSKTSAGPVFTMPTATLTWLSSVSHETILPTSTPVPEPLPAPPAYDDGQWQRTWSAWNGTAI